MDTELVRRGIADSRARALEAVLEGRVLVSGTLATKPERMVEASEPIELSGPPPPYVGRGGHKLEAALDEFGIDPGGKACLDVGASTGGFVDCLLQRGARSVVAVDVGRGQLAWSLRSDPRVVVLERTDVRSLDPGSVGPVDLVTVDVAFISLRTIFPALKALAGAAELLALCKPQFEVGRSRVGKGVVRDPALHRQALVGVVGTAASLGLRCVAAAPSVLEGAEGNREFFLLFEAAATNGVGA